MTNPANKIVNLGNGFVQVDDYVVEKRVLDVIEKIRDYDPNLDVLYLNPEKFNGAFDAPWVVVENCTDGYVRKVFDVWDMNESVFERLVNCDTKRVDVLANIDRVRSQEKTLLQKRYDEKREDASDRFAHLLKSPKTTYTLPDSDGNVITVDDHLGVTKRIEKV